MNHKQKISFRDPMVRLLTVLLVFITGGSLLGGCTGGGSSIGTKHAVAIDAAFGGDNPGAQGVITEAEFTENVINDLEALLLQDDRFDTYRTHAAGESASVAQKAAAINEKKPELVLSVHASGSPDPDRTGTVIYAALPGTETHDASLKFADLLKAGFASDSWTAAVQYLYYKQYAENSYQIVVADEADTAQRDMPTWDLLEQVTVPAVIADQIYVTNAAGVERWANDAAYEEAAQIYYKAICAYFGEEPLDITVPVPEESEETENS